MKDVDQSRSFLEEHLRESPASMSRGGVRVKLRSWWPIVLIAGGLLLYSAVFIWQTSFMVNGERYFALFDDSMVSMTYARNLARGDGLVWNPGGTRVEGFSNPLWVGLMALVHLLPLPMSKTSLVVQMFAALSVALMLPFVKLIAEHVMPKDRIAIWIAVLLAGFYYPLLNWSLLGTEVGLLSLISTVSAWLAVRALGDGRFPRLLYPALGIGTLVRIDGVIPMLAIMGSMFIFDQEHRWRHLQWGGVSLLAFVGGQTVLRLAYYGDWLPNTYYLKMTGYPMLLRMARGRSVAWDLMESVGVALVVLPTGALLLHGDRKRWLLLGVVTAELAYSIYVGGDAWEHRGGANRFIATVVPLFMVMYMAAWHELCEFLANAAKRIAGRVFHWQTGMWAVRVIRWAKLAAVVLIGFVSLLFFNRMKGRGPLLDDLRDLRAGEFKYALLLKRSVFVPGTERYTRDALVLRETTAENARIAVVAAGNTPYFSQRYAIDILGKSDQIIAHETARIPADRGHAIMFRPGHVKWDYAYSFGVLQPDVVVEPFRDSYDEAVPYLVDYESIVINGHPMYFRRGSTNVIWSALERYR